LEKSILDEIVEINKPILIIAGPGMGKTYTLAYKMRYLVMEKKNNPEKIIVITFTNEAAINMRKRISIENDKKVFINSELQPSIICTIHGFANRIVKKNYLKLGYRKNPTTLPSSGIGELLIRDCAQIIGSKRKDADNTIKCRQEGKCITKEESIKCKICFEYQKLLKRFNYIDFDEQIFLACKLLEEEPDILPKIHKNMEYLLVDEYQDINYAQCKLIKLLCKGKEEKLFAVGDSYQSIYSFRGGNPEYIDNFDIDYAPNSEIRHLTYNYRCPKNIFLGAFSMVQNYNKCNNDNFIEKLQFEKDVSTRIKLCNFQHQNIEAEFIARKMKEIGPSYSSIILIPQLNYAKPITDALKKRHINFDCEYEIEKTDIFLIFLLLKWLEKTSENFKFRIIIEKIIRKKIHSTIQRNIFLKYISNYWQEVGKCKTLYTKVKKLKKDKNFCEVINVLSNIKRAYMQGENTIDLITTIIQELKIWKDISGFKNEINSITSTIQSANISGKSNVRILTMKKAKGLEADYIFIVGLEDGILPQKSKTNLEEDSRLLYVAMTRAEKELYLLHSDKRDKKITKKQNTEYTKSMFINAIPSCYIEEI
jgi:DNA helicase-2/ATP-dependent DNA helicase PcrA